MPFAGALDAYLEEIEFLVRHRFPRPVAGAMERVVTEPTVTGRRRAGGAEVWTPAGSCPGGSG